MPHTDRISEKKRFSVEVTKIFTNWPGVDMIHYKVPGLAGSVVGCVSDHYDYDYYSLLDQIFTIKIMIDIYCKHNFCQNVCTNQN